MSSEPSSAFNIPEVYPVARRSLIEKAKSIDVALAQGSKVGSYSTAGWSNRLGTVLTPASKDVYTGDREFLWNSIDVGCRMTVIYLPETNGWFIHSPVAIDDRIQAVLPTLGGANAAQVQHIVSPNYEHVKFAKYWAQTYPEAKMWACPGLSSRETSTKWTGEIPEGVRPPSFPQNESSRTSAEMPQGFWDTDEIQAIHLNYEANPFTGQPFFNEVIFYHTPSKSLIVTDFFWNYPRSDGIPNSKYQSLVEKNVDFGEWEIAPRVEMPFKSLLWKFGMDQVYRPFYLNFMIEKQDEYKKVANFILNEWDIETLIPAHGDIIRGKELIRKILQNHLTGV
eukprot:CAMPEP_0172428290 /NCGR_PEP_ID=MMETSP1064-20121228/45793_1 /TAXON_ID=202472 /ORGANISM="Aulacoseira subarctica , Strain CCAP 1002/5" /LENGTH=337 /DNA_ID=CAMNT_0013172997 /DNA_START=132 /DNA_END=1145 /DNA_ORIENTATION=-